MNYDALFVNPNGTTARAPYIPAMITVIAAIVFYTYLVPSLLAIWVVLTLLYPAFVLLTRRVRDMGIPAWLVLVPLALMLATFANQLGYVNLSEGTANILKWAAYAVFVGFIGWGGVGSTKT
jgi:uncharacterized membrane protein YhaH (DUF805 family)